ncbi:hypothetical protein COT50_03825 [candidate division WWE3 bacterium CG08_land_8_20_14_0_20_41_10]|uniref:Peptidase M1 membrane alanine aminopeptidase domain-containing protein n=1 Tax=candidate division WWE3 bacterium CG08_land_8_20_14_0_20_41_10 TaxID=1975085 RepID=A0A2H0XAX7_UNCKA|nr:MAG: hypothetical protein COT50_03825 [candidate division WWE3 bacterium CG08_land_8_20_14_0_20_41_10]
MDKLSNDSLFLSHETVEKAGLEVSVTTMSPLGGEHADSDAEIVAKTERCVVEAIVSGSAFYGITLTELPKVQIGNRAEFNRVYEHETKEWVVGAHTHNGFIFLDPRLYRNTAMDFGMIAQTDHEFSEGQYLRLVAHEVGHLYFSALMGTNEHGSEMFMRWLNEGCQQVASGQVSDGRVSYEKFNADILDGSSANYFYHKSATVVMRMVEVYGQKDFVEKLRVLLSRTGEAFIKQDNDQIADPHKVFYDSFRELFGFELNKENLENFVKTDRSPTPTAK